MRLRDLEDKELISLQDGRRIGYFGDADLVFSGETGEIVGLEINTKSSILQFFSEKRVSLIPWRAVKKVGKEVIILDASAEADVDTFTDL
ncbi:MAG: YlmC/YmxH family sporulation protein [Firmicutes bacterium]|jgi:YlmC/YmxH family sporulation protein|nr:YlmC/YmxH family sporulation protein [Bacillota bacterium]